MFRGTYTGLEQEGKLIAMIIIEKTKGIAREKMHFRGQCLPPCSILPLFAIWLLMPVELNGSLHLGSVWVISIWNLHCLYGRPNFFRTL
jgi:hypothetical protein